MSLPQRNNKGRIVEWLIPKEEPDKTFYDVVYYRSNPFGFHDESEHGYFQPFVEVTLSDKHTFDAPKICHIGVDICARVSADSEEEAEKEFWRQYEMFSTNFE